MSRHLRTTRILLLACSIAVASACADSGGGEEVLTPYDAGHDDATNDTSFDAAVDADTGTDATDNDVETDAGEPDTDEPDTDVPNGDFCQPAGDGVIRRDRYPIEVGDSAPFLFSLDVEVDTAGEEIDGTLTWDLSQQKEGDFTDEVLLYDPADHWFGDEFPEASYTSELSAKDDDDEFGIFELTDDELRMLGVASPDDGYYRTELEHDPPVTILPFPLEVGKSWETEARASGAYGGNHIHGHDETYISEVDARGELITPYGTFDVLRVNTWLEQEVWLGGMMWVTDEIRTYTFVAECFGTVARITSPADEAEEDFEVAAEVMRLTL